MECVLPYEVERGFQDSRWALWNRDLSLGSLPAVATKDLFYRRLYNNTMDRTVYNTTDINAMQNNYFAYGSREKMLRNDYNDLDKYQERINSENSRKSNFRHIHENVEDGKFLSSHKDDYAIRYQQEHRRMTHDSKHFNYRTSYSSHNSVEPVENRQVHDFSPNSVTRDSPESLDYRKYYVKKSRMNEYSSMKDIDRSRPGVTCSLSYTTDITGQGSAQIRDSFIQSFSQTQNEPIMMAADREEGAINLSSSEAKHTPSEPSANTTAQAHSPESNGDIESQEQLSPQALNSFPGIPVSSAGVSKRKPRPPSQSQSQSRPASPSTNGSQAHQSALMLAAQQGLTQQQLQQILTANQQAGMIPPNLQQIMQAQQTAVMQQQQKVQEQALLQLNEQLQLNILQQSQLLQDKKTNGKQTQQQLQQLALQQQQLVQQIQQLQFQQRQFLLTCLMQQQTFTQQQGVLSPAEMHQIWKDIASSPTGTSSEGHKGSANGIGLGSLNGLGLAAAAAAGNPLLQGSLLGMNGLAHEAFPFAGSLIGQPQVAQVKQEEELTPLFRHGLCKWPGCDTECKDTIDFTKHLKSGHTLDDKNTAQARVQMQIVSQLEIQLTREKELLHAMMQHLHLHPLRDGREERDLDSKISEKLITSPKLSDRMSSALKSVSAITESLPKIVKPPQSLPHLSSAAGLAPLYIPPQSSLSSLSTPTTPIPHHSSASSASQPATPTGLGPMRRRVSDKCNLPISAEIQRNREFYRTTDVRPPFTYASLIRQAIIESENKQLTLNEVYQWFQNTFAYFRRNEATWKNAVRHNLSLHKCFMRVENVKGAVWTVDEHEFYKRRPQKLTGAIPGSPSMAADSGLYGDTINASLRQVAMFMSQHASSGVAISDNGMAEDLSMKSHSNSNDSFIKSEPLDREDMMFLKREAPYHEDVLSSNLQQDFSNSQSLDLSPRRNRQKSPLSSHNSPKNLSSPNMESSPLLKHYATAAELNSSDLYASESDKNTAKGFISAEQLKLLHAEQDNMAEQELQSRQHNSRAQILESFNGELKSESESGHDKESNKMAAVENYPDSPVQEQEMEDQEETYRYSTADEDRKERSQGSSPYSPKGKTEQILNNQEVYSQMMHASNMAAVSHSMT